MKISASIYSSKENNSESLVRELDAHRIDMLHVDCADEEKVFDDIVRIRKISQTPIDLHLITSEPEKYYDRIGALKIEYVSFQYENLNRIPILPERSGSQFGLSVTSSTPVDVFEQGKEHYSFMVMMSTVPGKSGGEFNRESFQKIIDFRHRFPRARVHVDGGVNDQIAYILRLLGVTVIVSGSYLLNHESLSAGMLSFHQTPDAHHQFKVSEFATPVKFLPVLNERQLNFETVLQTIEKYALGFVLITDDSGHLTGVISNADVRRGLLRNLKNLNEASAREMINKNPITVRDSASVSDIVHQLNELSFIVLFLPVVDEKNMLKGAVLLNNLTRV